MSNTAVIPALALGAVLVWKIGAPVARFVGTILVIASLTLIVLGAPIVPQLLVIVAGGAVWLAVHFLAAYKTRFWHSPLAELIVTHTRLRCLDPARGCEHRRAPRTARERYVALVAAPPSGNEN
ncbi:hypothetical protein [Rhodococcus sp. O3]|uniref:hypothetical protein n=1 Tax=Rhodococcus sp. O3 TaxID=3404919 RepID=UPI003B6842F6